jgi:Flp pilus assembly protein TadD
MALFFRVIFIISLILTILVGCATTEEIKETDPDALLNQGATYAAKGQYDRAIAHFNKAIELNPRDAWAYNFRGLAYVEKGQYDKAISDCTKAIELNPRLAGAYNNRGIAYFCKREYEKAWDDVHKARNLGYLVDPVFLKVLRQASGRQE